MCFLGWQVQKRFYPKQAEGFLPANGKYHYQRYASLPHATAALFARHSSLTALTSIPDFSIPSYALPHGQAEGAQKKILLQIIHKYGPDKLEL